MMKQSKKNLERIFWESTKVCTDLNTLFDERLVAQTDGEGALWHHQQHVALLLPGLDVLHEAGYLPLRYGGAAEDHRAVHGGGVWGQLEVAVS